jgi:hypothetical protein
VDVALPPKVAKVIGHFLVDRQVYLNLIATWTKMTNREEGHPFQQFAQFYDCKLRGFTSQDTGDLDQDTPKNVRKFLPVATRKMKSAIHY